MEEEQEQPEWAVGPEDEYDALNDETFGDAGEEYTWGDESQNVLPDVSPANRPADLSQQANCSNSSNGWNRNVVQQVATPPPQVAQVVHSNEARSKDPDYYDYENDNALEESISRLVLDDMEDTEDEEEARKMKLSRLGATSNFNTYFMPPQVATKHLHWLMDKELPGGSSLLGSSVWSMHPTSTPADVDVPVQHHHHHHHQQQQVQQVNMTPNRMMTAHHSIPKQEPHLRTNHLSNEIDMLDSENNVSKFFSGVPSSTPLNSASKKKPVFKTVEEIERELLEGGDVVSAPSPKTPASSIVRESEVLNHSSNSSVPPKPKILMAEDLERELIQDSPMPTPKMGEIMESEMGIAGRSPLQVLSQQQLSNQQSQDHPASMAQQQQQQQQENQTPQKQPLPQFGHPSNVNFGGGAGTQVLNANAALNNFLMMEQQKQLILARQGLIPGPGLTPQVLHHPGLIPPHQLPPQIAQNLQHSLHQHQQHIRMLHLHPHLRARLPLMAMPIPPGIPPHLRQQQPPGLHQQMAFAASQHQQGFRNKQMMKTDDPYRGLMNEKDKQRLRNIQIIQLQNDHPFTTDYFNLMHKAKQAAPAGLQLLVKLYPKRDDEKSQRSQYEPARFDNCLGKLQAVSALAPKRVIDTFIRVTESRNASRGGAYRYLLLEIEKLYECLLVMEESDIRTSILCNADEKDMERRTQQAGKVAKVLSSTEKLLSILGVPKGKMLVFRTLPLIEPTVRYKVLGHLLDVFPMWRDQDKAFPYLRHCILHAEIRDLLSVVGSVTDNQMFESIVVSKLGLTVLMCIFHQAEHLLTRCDQMLVEDLESHWTRKSMFCISSILVKNEHLPNPIEFYPNLLHHIQRFACHGTDVQVLESILQRWANSGVSARP